MQSLAELVSQKHAAAEQLLTKSDGVIGVGLGARRGEPCLRVYVERKLPLSSLPREEVVPSGIGALRTDVVEIGRLAAGPAIAPRTRQRVRPVRPGCSVGYAQPMAGTVGAIVRDRQGELHLLSCNHVLADENTLAEGAPIFQPALLDEGRRDRDQVAQLSRYVRLEPRAVNRVDGALARALNRYNVDGSILPHARLMRLPPAQADVGMRVHKSGRSTGHTRGCVIDTAVDLKIFYRSGIYRFADQILIEGSSFSQPGDSGSLILEEESHRPVGLLFAGSPTHTVANPISEVLAALDVELVS
jgi:hypothetical protein